MNMYQSMEKEGVNIYMYIYTHIYICSFAFPCILFRYYVDSMLVDPMFFHHFSFFLFLEFNGYIVTQNRYIYVYTYIHTSIHTYIHTCIHTYILLSCFCPVLVAARKTQIELMYIFIYTSGTAQGGGGSFKNRKPIGEAVCCESGMAERSH